MTARSFLLLTAALIAGFMAPIALADPELDGRVGRLERILENQSGSELLLQMQRLQTEMQELRGMVEQQRFDIDKLQRQQRDQFIDLDSRLNAPRTSAQSPQPSDGSGVTGDPTRPELPPGMVDASGGALEQPPGV
ncbi:hypothetical protein CKO27_22845, partial [Thiocystis violacea]|nr:hypothetical protein [Thiocystis violacea]